jgi:alpha-galactosidase/6-phospho-beta-glucosidase family protein
MKATTQELMVNIMEDIEKDLKRKEISVNVPNTSRAIENLQPDVIIEVPAIVGRDGISPVRIGRLPESLAGVCQLQACIQNLLVEAYAEKSKKALFQAIAVDPVVDNLASARAMMEHLLRLEAEYLPELR